MAGDGELRAEEGGPDPGGSEAQRERKDGTDGRHQQQRGSQHAVSFAFFFAGAGDDGEHAVDHGRGEGKDHAADESDRGIETGFGGRKEVFH